MCGIFFYKGPARNVDELRQLFMKTKHRGPDSRVFKVFYLDSGEMVAMGFHRLAINGMATTDEQPFHSDHTYVMCNGEIWNHNELRAEGGEANESDCKCLLPYYRKHGMQAMCDAIDGVFGCVVYDEAANEAYVGRDPVGIRSVYWHQDAATKAVFVASELKSFPCEYDSVMPVPPGHFARLTAGTPVAFERYSTPSSLSVIVPSYTHGERLERIRHSLTEAVRKRFMSDRPVGCILSGGLDSTLITAIACRIRAEQGGPTNAPMRMRTYTIGMQGGEDLKWARLAAEHLGTEHHEFVVSEAEFLAAIPNVVTQVESFDVTTVRASVGNWLVAKKIAELGKDVVLFCGDVADELLGGYRGFGLAHNAADFREANGRMMRDVHCFDVLRSEKSFTAHGLEGRVPFADKAFVATMDMYAPTEHRMWGHDGRIEKHVLREAFEGYLPKELLWRRKEAFSDGVSGDARSWYTVIQEHIARSGIEGVLQREHMCPYDAESSYYRTIFETAYASVRSIPYFWKHPFTSEVDPSARKLSNY
jgi:asparagine synthase (glutamine-hydrolysing)